MKQSSLLRVICLVAIFFMVGCTGQALDNPITTRSGLAFMFSKQMPAGDLSDLDASLTERSEKDSESAPAQPEAIGDCPVDQLEDIDLKGI